MLSKAQLLTIYASQKDELVKAARRILGDHGRAEDVVQEAYLRFADAAALRPLEEPSAYLHRIVRNLSLDARRQTDRERRRVSDSAAENLEAIRSEDPTPENQASARQELRLLQQALAELPKRTRQVLVMYWYEGFTLREIAETMEISLGLTHSLVADGLEHCRRKLKRQRN